MNFIFECQEQYLTSESIDTVHTRHTDEGVLTIFRRFPTIFRRFLKNFQNCSESQTNVPENFPSNSESFPRFPKIAENVRETPKDVSIIHQQI